MKRMILVFAMLAFACANMGLKTLSAHYKTTLISVDRSNETKSKYGDLNSISFSGDSAFFEDQLIKGTFYITSSRINFILKNKTEQTIKVLWDAAAFIGVEGQSGKVSHLGTKYIDRSMTQTPSIIPAGALLSDFIIPNDRIYYRQGSYSGGWEETDLLLPKSIQYFHVDSSRIIKFKSEAENNRGKKFGLLLPIEADGYSNEYTFWFEVNDMSIGQTIR
jgi:hypothetical protein